jgi:hypothetical protein
LTGLLAEVAQDASVFDGPMCRPTVPRHASADRTEVCYPDHALGIPERKVFDCDTGLPTAALGGRNGEPARTYRFQKAAGSC